MFFNTHSSETGQAVLFSVDRYFAPHILVTFGVAIERVLTPDYMEIWETELKSYEEDGTPLTPSLWVWRGSVESDSGGPGEGGFDVDGDCSLSGEIKRATRADLALLGMPLDGDTVPSSVNAYARPLKWSETFEAPVERDVIRLPNHKADCVVLRVQPSSDNFGSHSSCLIAEVGEESKSWWITTSQIEDFEYVKRSLGGITKVFVVEASSKPLPPDREVLDPLDPFYAGIKTQKRG